MENEIWKMKFGKIYLIKNDRKIFDSENNEYEILEIKYNK